MKPLRLFHTFGMINWNQFAVSVFFCPLCGGKRPFVRLDANEISVRCLSCRATAITSSLVHVLQCISPNLNSKKVYELSSRGPLFEYLKQTSKELAYSEFSSNTAPGEYNNGIQCQDVQRLTYENNSFDVCTSTEVLEHVPDDAKGFSEIHRVLKPNGVFLFTVPLAINNKTVERAETGPSGDINYLLPPEYHSDPSRFNEPILAFRNYGYDILDRLLNAGFRRAEIRSPGENMAWGFTRPVIVAYRDIASNKWLNSDPLLLRFVSQ